MAYTITMGSLFSGIGGFEVAASWYDDMFAYIFNRQSGI